MLQKWAQEIAQSTSEVIGFDVIITDIDGVIIGASDRERIGELHEQSLQVIRDHRGSSVDEDEAREFRGTLPGITYPIQSMTGKVVGSMAITGKPDQVKPFALIVKKQIEILLREREMQEYASTREESLQNIFHDISHFTRGVTDQAMLQERAREFGFDPSSFYIPITMDLYQFARYARQVRKKYMEGPADSPEFTIQRTKSHILLLLRRTFNGAGDFTVMTGNNKYAVLHSIGKHPEEKEREISGEVDRKCWKIKEELSEMKLNAAIGIGSISRNLEELCFSIEEAWRALNLGKKFNQGPGVFNIQDFRLEELLVSIRPSLRNRFIHSTLAPFRKQHDWEDLKDTLLAWCECDFSLIRAAERLHIHRNTLTYRLDKLEKICGKDLKDYRQTLEMYLAFRLDQFVGPARKEDSLETEMFNSNHE